jgi:beta-glucosidase
MDQLTARTRDIISRMTLNQKVHEMSGRGLAKLGISFLFTGRISPVKFGGNKNLGIPAGVFFDGPRGISLYSGATAFPVPSARAASWDRELEGRVGEAMSAECRALGGNYLGAVCVNLLRHPANGRAQEAYGEDPFLAGEMGVALVQGIQSNGVQACVKHLALNSMENNRFGVNVRIDERSLNEVYLPHFKKIVQSGAASVMSAYNKMNGEYCGENRDLLYEILRQEWGFTGYVTSDWQFGLFDTVKGIKARMNIEMPAAKCYTYKNIKRLLKEDQISVDEIDALIFPVIRTKLLFQSAGAGRRFPRTLVGSKEHRELAGQVAEQSIVLLKNSDHVLPLSKEIRTIAVIGSLASCRQTGDRGSSQVLPRYTRSLKDALVECCPAGIKILTAKNSETKKLKAICGRADAVVVMAGNTWKDEGEYISMGNLRDLLKPYRKSIANGLGMFGLGGDRNYLHLHPADTGVIRLAAGLNKKVIVCLAGGSAITVEEWYKEVPAILHTFYSGMEGGRALAAILFGDVNPGGRLPFTVPVSADDLPEFNSFATEVTYGYYHGYTLFDKTRKQVRFPFGYGLSYTTFQLSGLNLENTLLSEEETLQVSVTVTNTGTSEGSEVVQLYTSFENSAVDRARKLLRGFVKVRLKPGAAQTVHFSVPVRDLAWYDPGKHGWEVEKMDYTVIIGFNADDPGSLNSVFTVRQEGERFQDQVQVQG